MVEKSFTRGDRIIYGLKRQEGVYLAEKEKRGTPAERPLGQRERQRTRVLGGWCISRKVGEIELGR